MVYLCLSKTKGMQVIMNKKKIVAVIPSRYGSSRFPGKPLALIAGKTMIHRVYDQVYLVDRFDDIIIATDDERIKKETEKFGAHVIMTGECACGTERVYQAVHDLEADVIINIQGDEPLIKKEMIFDLLEGFEDPTVQMVTLKKKDYEKRRDRISKCCESDHR